MVLFILKLIIKAYSSSNSQREKSFLSNKRIGKNESKLETNARAGSQ